MASPLWSRALVVSTLALIVWGACGVALVVPPGRDESEALALLEARRFQESGRLPRPDYRPRLGAWPALLGSLLAREDQVSESGTALPIYERFVPLPRGPKGWRLLTLRLLGIVLGALVIGWWLFRLRAELGTLGLLGGLVPMVLPAVAASLALLDGSGVVFAVMGLGWCFGWRRRSRLPRVAGALCAGLAVVVAPAAWPAAALTLFALSARASVGRMGLWLAAALPAALWWSLPSGWVDLNSSPLSGSAWQATPRSWSHAVHLVQQQWPRLLGELPGCGGPGFLWLSAALAAAAAFLILALAAGRKGSPEGRLGLVFLLALVSDQLLRVSVTRRWEPPDPRGALGMAFPAGLLFPDAARLLLGARARRALGALAIGAALGGPLLLHGELLPRLHPRLDCAEVAGARFFLDLGTPEAQSWVLRGEPSVDRPLGRLDETRRQITAPGGQPVSLSLRWPALPRAELHLLSLRLGVPHPDLGLRSLSHSVASVDGRALGGAMSHHLLSDRWIHFAVPPARSIHTLDLKGSGRQIALSALRVRSLAVTLTSEKAAEGWTLNCKAHDGFEGLSLRLDASQGPGPALQVRHLESGNCYGSFPEDLEETRVRLTAPNAHLSALKAVVFTDPQALRSGVLDQRRDLGARRESPGFYLLNLSPKRHRGQVVLRLEPDQLPLHPGEFRFLDGYGQEIPAGVLETLPGDSRAPSEAQGFDLGGQRPTEALRFRFVGAKDAEIDQIWISGELRWEFTLHRP